MEINGTIYKILPQQEVTFSDGTTKKKGGFVIMREGDYPRPVAFELFGEDRLALLANVNVGMPVQVRFFAESREGRNGNYFTTLRCFGITPAVATTAPASNTPTEKPSQGLNNPVEQSGDLPWDNEYVPF